MTRSWFQPAEGGCACGHVRYRVELPPMFVHCCHCRWCQRETGSAFVLNALIEADRVELISGEVEVVHTPSESGRGQKIHRCPSCKIALWSNYAGTGPSVLFLRVGTLDDPDRFPPDVQIFTGSKQPWFDLPPGAPVFEEFYRFRDQWPEESIERYKAAQRRSDPTTR